MAWIESHQELVDHPKTQKLARLLGLSIPATIGHLHCLWYWATDYARDGDLSRFDSLDIALGARWDDDPDPFIDNLLRAGFLDQAENGMVIHDWYDYAGKLIERRAANAERMRSARATHESSTKKERAPHVQRTHHARATLQNRTQQNTTEQDQDTPLPPKGETPAKPEEGPIYPKAMELFWSTYDPQGRERSSRAQVFEVWSRMKPSTELTAAIMEGLERWVASEKWREGFAPGAHLFLKRRLWAEQPAPPPTAATPPRRGSPTAGNADAFRIAKERAAQRAGQRAAEEANVFETQGHVR